MSNGAGKEKEVSHIHGLVTKLMTMKGESMLAQAEELMLQDATYVINMRDVSAMAKFALENNVTMALDEDEKGSEFNRVLSKLQDKSKKKVVPFLREEVNSG